MQLCDRLPSSPGKTRMFPIIFSLSSFVVALYVVSRVLRKHYLLASQGSLAVLGKLDVTRWNCALNCAALQIFGERFDPPAVRSVKQDAEVKTSTTYIFYALTRWVKPGEKEFSNVYSMEEEFIKVVEGFISRFHSFLAIEFEIITYQLLVKLITWIYCNYFSNFY